MKTLHVDTGREMGGGQWQVLYLLERLQDAQLLARGPLLDEARARGIDVSPFSVTRLITMSRGVDLVHAHDARAHTLAILSGGAPLVVSRRVGFDVRSPWKYRYAAAYFAISNFVAARLIDAGVEKEKISVIHDGVTIPPNAASPTGRVIALPNKCTEIVRAAAESAGVPIHFTSKLWQDLSTASVFVYASELEGLGSAALAAMASGVPVIATPVGGLPEAVEHGRTGLLAEPAELAGALKRLLDHPDEAAEMGRRGRERAIEKFSADRMAEETLRAYHEVIRC